MRTWRRGREELVRLVDVDGPPETGEPLALQQESSATDFEPFYRRELPGLVVLARVLAGPARAEDVAQESMLVAFRKWDTVHGYGSRVRWVRGVCLHKAASVVHRRDVERRLLRQLGRFRAENTVAVGEDERFWQAVRALPLPQGHAIALHYALDLPVTEVAATTGFAEADVRAQLSQARSALATTLRGPEGGPAVSIDALARRLSERAREDVEESLDVVDRLGDLHAVRRRRRLTQGAAGLVALAAVGGVTLGVLSPPTEDQVPPGGTGLAVRVEDTCPDSDVVECLDGSTVLVRSEVPYTFTIPEGMHRIVAGTAASVDLYSEEPEESGITILSGVEPPGRSRVEGAEELAQWVASRDFVSATPVVRRFLNDLATWTLDVRPAGDGLGRAGACNFVQDSCQPVLEEPARLRWQTGLWNGTLSRYTFLDVPGLGIVVVWSWVFQDGDLPWYLEGAVLDRHEALTGSLDFRR